MSSRLELWPPTPRCMEQCPAGAACACRIMHAPPRTGRPKDRARLAGWQVRVAQQQILSQLDRAIALRDIAERLNVSHNHFLKAFKNTIGVPPHRWILYQRLCLSLRLLAQDGLTLAEIAAECGFSDQSHFHRIFLRNMGTTPGQWRRSRAEAGKL